MVVSIWGDFRISVRVSGAGRGLTPDFQFAGGAATKRVGKERLFVDSDGRSAHSNKTRGDREGVSRWRRGCCVDGEAGGGKDGDGDSLAKATTGSASLNGVR